jgi:hypothetical protein
MMGAFILPKFAKPEKGHQWYQIKHIVRVILKTLKMQTNMQLLRGRSMVNVFAKVLQIKQTANQPALISQ